MRGRDDGVLHARICVRKLRRIPNDPFASDYDYPSDGIIPEEEVGEQCADSETEEQRADSETVEVREGDVALYSDGGSNWIGLVCKCFTSSLEIHDCIVKTKSNRLKVLKMWTDLTESNYRPKNSEPVIYRIDNRAVRRIVSLEKNFLPADDDLNVVVVD